MISSPSTRLNPPVWISTSSFVSRTTSPLSIQTGGFNRVEGEEITFAWLEKNGHIRVGTGEIEAVAVVTPAVRRGVLFSYFLSPPNPFNALAHRVADPIANNYRYKLAKAKVARVGESPYKKDRRFMSFQRRDFGGTP